MRTVKVGEKSYTIPTFRGYKGTYAGVILSGALGEVQDVLSEVASFQRRYAEENPLRITREGEGQRASGAKAAMAEIRELLDSNEEVFEARIKEDNREEWDGAEDEEARKDILTGARRVLEARLITLQGRIDSAEQTIKDMGDRAYIELPGEPEEWQLYAVGFSKAFGTARDELVKLLGLVVIPNGDLERADDEGHVDDELQKLGKRLLFDGEVDELIRLMAEAGEVLEEQLNKSRTALGKLNALWRRAWGTEEMEETTVEGTAVEAETSTPSSPSSPTPSPPPTDGDEGRPSSESRGESSVASAPA